MTWLTGGSRVRNRPAGSGAASRSAGLVALVLLAVAVLLLCGPAGPADGASTGGVDLIVTEVPVGTAGGPVLPCAAGSRLVRLDGASGAGGRTVLTGDMDAACDPVLSADADRLVFRGRRTAADPWRIWELSLAAGRDRELRSLSPADRSCVRPWMLADEGVGFVCAGDLFRTPADGADASAGPVRLTASGGTIEEATVLPDGRFLLRSRDGEGVPLLLTSQPDGTWATRWRDAPVAGLESARPLPPDRLLVATGAPERSGLWLGSLVDPFAPLRPVAEEALDGGVARDPAPLPDGRVVVSFRPADRDRFGLAALSVDGGGLTPLAGAGASAHALQPVPIAPRSPDTEIPSIVKPELNTGYLVLFDAGRSDHPAYGEIDPETVAAVRIFPWQDGPDGGSGVDLTPADDGSLHLEVPSDRALGFTLVDRDGRPLGPPGGPLWVRPNERRACMGCHVSRRYAPPNVRPRALLDPPRWVGWGAERVSPRSEFEEGSH